MVTHRCQVVIVGAGIAGLWLYRHLLARGIDALLLENRRAGQMQTLASQGILHSGVKYRLDGSSSAIAELLRSQPPIWLDAMRGQGAVSLVGTKATAEHQYMWAGGGIASKVAAFVGAKSMISEVQEVARKDWPQPLIDGGHRGSVYRIAETVIDTKTAVHALLRGADSNARQGEIQSYEFDASGKLVALVVKADAAADAVRLEAGAFIFTAGRGNELAAEKLGLGIGVTQCRPLKMVMMRGRLPKLFGHVVVASHRPRATITSHELGDEVVWYLGGQIAETCTTLDDAAGIEHAKQEVHELFPGMNLAAMQVKWALHAVDRAEPNHSAGWLPDGPVLLPKANAALAWPTKLVYAPALADKATAFLDTIALGEKSNGATVPLPPMQVGSYPWETTGVWL